MTRITSIAVSFCIVVLLAGFGCTSRTQTYPNHTVGQVWAAMQAVAESPEYDDWHVMSNDVWVDDEQARIEVYREVRRTLHRPRSQPLNQRRTWRLQMLLVDDDPPTVRIVSRGIGIPAHAQEETDRSLIDIRKILQTEFATQRRPGITPGLDDADITQPEALPEVDLDDLD